MKRILLILCVAAACVAQAATAFPDLGNARIIVLANNLQNYYAENPADSQYDGCL